jgi:glutamate racemase
MQNNPIGIFDSGIGGLTVAKAIHNALPNEQLVYFGDIAHLPYGDKSAEAIKGYALKIADFLTQQQCKAIVIACNTASAYANTALVQKLKNTVPIFNVVDPMANYVATNFANKKVGIIGTKGTVSSGIYKRKIHANNKQISVNQLATPLLAPMIEEGFFNNVISKTVIHSYLTKSNLQNIQGLVLGCTHYPLIKKEIKQYYKQQKQATEVIDSSEIIAQVVQSSLAELNLLNTSNAFENSKFYASDLTKAFQKSAKLFFGQNITLEKVDLWNQPNE